MFPVGEGHNALGFADASMCRLNSPYPLQLEQCRNISSTLFSLPRVAQKARRRGSLHGTLRHLQNVAHCAHTWKANRLFAQRHQLGAREERLKPSQRICPNHQGTHIFCLTDRKTHGRDKSREGAGLWPAILATSSRKAASYHSATAKDWQYAP